MNKITYDLFPRLCSTNSSLVEQENNMTINDRQRSKFLCIG